MSAKAVTALCNHALAPVKVHVVPGLLEKIAELVLEGYVATSHGGLEIGGLLFGHRNSGFITVEDFRPLACDHSLGPRFILSDTDERNLRELLCSPAIDPKLQGLCTVGWYCSHTRSDLLLLDRELLLHDTYFPGSDDFVTVFKPRDLRSVTAGIFLRDTDRAMDPQCPATILELPELDITRQRTRTEAGNVCDLSALSSRSAPARVNEHALTLQYRLSAIESVASPQPIDQPGAVLANATTKAEKRHPKSAKLKLLLAAAGAIALLCLGAWRYFQAAHAHPTNLFLSLRPHAGKLLLSWKTNVVRPHRAHVDIFDGTSTEHVNITDIFQPSGVLLFPHKDRNVQAVLTLETGNGVVVRYASFTDASAAIKDPAVSEEKSENGPPGMNPAAQQLASKVTTSKHPRRRHSRRTRHKKMSPLSAPLQPGDRANAGQH
ncbi:MAG: hypothetical protein ACR2JB_25605 [Bryobacteraceae bacterium]